MGGRCVNARIMMTPGATLTGSLPSWESDSRELLALSIGWLMTMLFCKGKCENYITYLGKRPVITFELLKLKQFKKHKSDPTYLSGASTFSLNFRSNRRRDRSPAGRGQCRGRDGCRQAVVWRLEQHGNDGGPRTGWILCRVRWCKGLQWMMKSQ